MELEDSRRLVEIPKDSRLTARFRLILFIIGMDSRPRGRGTVEVKAEVCDNEKSRKRALKSLMLDCHTFVQLSS